MLLQFLEVLVGNPPGLDSVLLGEGHLRLVSDGLTGPEFAGRLVMGLVVRDVLDVLMLLLHAHTGVPGGDHDDGVLLNLTLPLDIGLGSVGALGGSEGVEVLVMHLAILLRQFEL